MTQKALSAVFKKWGVKNSELFSQALTHSSYAHAHKVADNERLEFLGDAILSAIVAEELYVKNPALAEGELTKRRAQAVRGKSLAAAARALGLETHLRHCVRTREGKALDNLLEQAFEAVVGAMFVEQGYEKTRRFVLKHLPMEEAAMVAGFNPKGALQELLQPEIPTTAIEYVLLKTEGPDHARRFTVALKIQGREVARATAASKKAAEELAAEAGLEKLRK